MNHMRPAKLGAILLFAIAWLSLETGVTSLGGPFPALAQDAFVGAKGSASTPASPAAPPYRPGAAPGQGQASGSGQAGQDEALSRPAPAPRTALAIGKMDLLDQGEFAAAAGRFAEAERLWGQALAQNPNWGTVKHRLAELPARRAAFAPDLALQEQRRQARLALVEGVTHFNARQYQEAAQHFQHYLAVFPEDAQIRADLDLALGQGASLAFGSLRVVCQPKAEVLLDGSLVGLTPLSLPQVARGAHRIEVRAHGGSQAQALEIRGGGTTDISFRLLGGFLAVNAQPWAQIALDGQPVGQTPLTLDNLVLGAHQVSASHPGLPEQSRQVFLEAGRTIPLQFNLAPR